MVAATVFALLLGTAARAADSAARLLSWQGRAPWVVALAASVLWPVLLPLVARQKMVRLSPVMVDGGAVRTIAARLPELPPAITSRLDAALVALWLLASLLLVARLIHAHRALARVSRSAQSARIDGHEVLLTDGIGPAVLGFVAPRVAVPAWLTELDRPLRDLVLRHEREHCRSRDTVLLWLGEVAVALMPWNPAVWWQARQLRLALELDCDSRTLRDPGAAATYGKLLLLIAQRQHMTRLAPMLAESSSHLSRRITAMTRRSVSYQPLRVAVLGAIAIVATIAACSSRVGSDLVGPQPTAGKPLSAQSIPNMPGPKVAKGVYFEYQVEQPVMAAAGSPAPRYPDILKTAGVSGEVIASFVVDTTGIADVGSRKVIKSSHELFVNAVAAALPDMRFTPALVGGKKVKQLVMEPFVFQIVDSAKAASKSAPGVPKPASNR
jgi:beta-lactamase regulating signal transducer with metallopeptidase domain